MDSPVSRSMKIGRGPSLFLKKFHYNNQKRIILTMQVLPTLFCLDFLVSRSMKIWRGPSLFLKQFHYNNKKTNFNHASFFFFQS